MTAPSGLRLTVDFGTSNTVAMLRWPDGRVRPLLFDGSPLLSSAVLLGVDGHLYTGRDAAHLGRANPERLEPNPKRRIDDHCVLLGDREVPVRDLVATVLRRVAAEAYQVTGGAVADVVLTHPAAWGAARRALLTEAAEHSGLGRPHLVGEPVAAAMYFGHLTRDSPPSGGCLLVYDLGAGTCDVTLLRRQPHGFEVIASDGLDDVGGLDVDAAVVTDLAATHGPLWTDGVTRRQLWDEVRTAKEMLSRVSRTVITIPTLGREVPLGREQLEELARPVLQPTIAMTSALLTRASLDPTELGGLFLVGGSSKIPLVTTLLHHALGTAPVITEQPELVVAEGALHLFPTRAPAAGKGAPPPDPAPPVAPTNGSPPSGTARARRPAVAAVAAGAALMVALSAGTAGYWWADRGLTPSAARPDPTTKDDSPTGEASPTGETSPTAVPAPTTSAREKYDLRRLPTTLCDKVDLRSLATMFGQQRAEPADRHSQNETIITLHCSLNREHTDAPNYVLLRFDAWAYDDPAFAVNSYQTRLTNAKQTMPGPRDVPGIGEQAFIHSLPPPEQDAGGLDPRMGVIYILEARDGNLCWTVTLSALRIQGSIWSEQEHAQLQAGMIDSLAATHARFIKAL